MNKGVLRFLSQASLGRPAPPVHALKPRLRYKLDHGVVGGVYYNLYTRGARHEMVHWSQELLPGPGVDPTPPGLSSGGGGGGGGGGIGGLMGWGRRRAYRTAAPRDASVTQAMHTTDDLLNTGQGSHVGEGRSFAKFVTKFAIFPLREISCEI